MIKPTNQPPNVPITQDVQVLFKAGDDAKPRLEFWINTPFGGRKLVHTIQLTGMLSPELAELQAAFRDG